MALKEYKSKKECINHIRKQDIGLTELDADKLENMIFRHHNTYTLTDYGKFLLTKYYDNYTLPFAAKTLKQKVMLNRVFDSPYHYCTKANELTLLDGELSFLIKLSGDVSVWMENEFTMKAI